MFPTNSCYCNAFTNFQLNLNIFYSVTPIIVNGDLWFSLDPKYYTVFLNHNKCLRMYNNINIYFYVQ